MTRQEFEEGKVFWYNGRKYKYIPRQEGQDLGFVVHVSWEESGYEANVTDINGEGFAFFGFVLNAEASGSLLFKHCKLMEKVNS